MTVVDRHSGGSRRLSAIGERRGSLSRRALLGLSSLLWLIGASYAVAGFGASRLDELSVEAKANARLPLDTSFLDETGATRSLTQILDGRPAALLFVDYSCRTLCRPMLHLVAASLAETGLAPGDDFRLVTIGIDPSAPPEAMVRMKAEVAGAHRAVADAATLLKGDAAAIGATTSALGYRFAYDRDRAQFAHPAALFVVAPDGRVARIVPALGRDATELRTALVEAGRGRVGAMLDRIRVLCYGFDPESGVYTASALRALRIGGAATAAALCGAIGVLALRGGRRRSE
jgi:protein SCO1/2